MSKVNKIQELLTELIDEADKKLDSGLARKIREGLPISQDDHLDFAEMAAYLQYLLNTEEQLLETLRYLEKMNAK